MDEQIYTHFVKKVSNRQKRYIGIIYSMLWPIKKLATYKKMASVKMS